MSNKTTENTPPILAPVALPASFDEQCAKPSTPLNTRNTMPTIPTVRQLIGMSHSHRKRLARRVLPQYRHLFYIGRHLGFCPGCCICQRIKLHPKHAPMLGVTPEMLTDVWICNGRLMHNNLITQPLIPERYHRGIHCSGSGIIDKTSYCRHCIDGIHKHNNCVTIALQKHREWPVGLPKIKPVGCLQDNRVVWSIPLSQWNSAFYHAVFERVTFPEPAR